MFVSRLIPATVFILTISTAGADDWTMYLRDPAHSSFNVTESQVDKTKAASLSMSWLYAGPGTIASGVTMADNVLYFGDWSGYFHAVAAADGTELWSQFVGISASAPDCMPALGVSGQAAISGNTVYVPGGDSAVYALDKKTGNVLWRTQLADPSTSAYLWSSVTLSKNALYIGIASLGDCPLVRGAIVRIGLDAPDHPLFHYLAPEDELGGGVWSTPAVDEQTNTLFITTGTGMQDADLGRFGGTLLSMDATTLEIKSYYFLPTNSTVIDIEWGSSPTLFFLSDGTPMVGATGKDGILYALTRDGLTPRWTTQLALSCPCPQCGCGSLSTPAFDGKLLYAGAGVDPYGDNLGTLYAVEPDGGRIVWTQPIDGTVIAPATIANGVLYAGTTTGAVALNAATGEMLWEDDFFDPCYGQPLMLNGTLYVPYTNGNVIAWRPASAAQ